MSGGRKRWCSGGENAALEKVIADILIEYTFIDHPPIIDRQAAGAVGPHARANSEAEVGFKAREISVEDGRRSSRYGRMIV
jgi:hypothetical protein